MEKQQRFLISDWIEDEGKIILPYSKISIFKKNGFRRSRSATPSAAINQSMMFTWTVADPSSK
jgi:predicted amidohydrolase